MAIIHIGWGDREIDRAPVDTEEDQGRADVEVDHDAFISCNYSVLPKESNNMQEHPLRKCNLPKREKEYPSTIPKNTISVEVSKKGKKHPKEEGGLPRGTPA